VTPAVEVLGVDASYPLQRGTAPSLRMLPALAFGSRRRQERLWALRGVSISVAPGEAVGLVGPNGAGKSTLLRLLAGVIRPTRGRVLVRGAVAPLLDLGAGIDPAATAAENVVLYGSLLGRHPRTMRAHVDEILDWAGVAAYADVPVAAFSSGMFARLVFAIATSGEPRVVLIDEVLGVGDAAFFDRSTRRLASLVERGASLVVASHAPEQLRRITKRALLLQEGRIVADGATDEIVDLHLAAPGMPIVPRSEPWNRL
jgi:ABC-2 type transport system ATP-binding protein